MSYKSLLAIFVFASVPALFAQQDSSEKIVLPSPILAKVPDMASWTVMRTARKPQASEQKGAPKAESDTSPSEPAPPTSKTVFTKTAPITQIVTTDAFGGESHHWCVGDTQFIASPKADDVGVVDPNLEGFRKSDFQEFSWISPAKFVGLSQYQGHPCWVFKDRVLLGSKREFDEAKMRAIEEKQEFTESVYYADEVAFVNAKTQLPLALVIGDEIYSYTFNQPPTAKLVLPPNIEKRVKGSAERLKALQAGPPRPF